MCRKRRDATAREQKEDRMKKMRCLYKLANPGSIQ